MKNSIRFPASRTKTAVLLFAVMFGCNGGGTDEGAHRVGAVLPLTGPAAQYGEWVRNGIDVAVDQLEKSNPGVKFNVLYQDDQNAADRSITALRKLKAVDKVPVVIGAVTSGCTTAIAPIAQQDKVVLVSPSSSAPSLSEIGNFFFRVWSSDELASRQLAAQIIKDFNPESVALLYVNNDYGQGVNGLITKVFEEANVRIAAAEGYSPGNSDFRAHLTRIKDKEPDLILLIGYANELAYAVKQAGELEVATTLVGQEGIESDLLLEVAGKAAEGLVYYVPQFDPEAEDDNIQSFASDYEEKYGESPEIFAAHGYDAMMVIGKALIAAKDSGAESVRDAISRTKNHSGVTGIISFDENGDVQKSLMAKVVKNGKFTIRR